MVSILVDSFARRSFDSSTTFDGQIWWRIASRRAAGTMLRWIGRRWIGEGGEWEGEGMRDRRDERGNLCSISGFDTTADDASRSSDYWNTACVVVGTITD